MTIRRQEVKRFEGLEWKSGSFYKFKYRAYQNDKYPHIIFMYAFSGYHPNTGRQWRFFQAINFSYIPRNVRKRFMKEYLEIKRRSPNIKFTWQEVKSKYPWLRIAVRRYFYTPGTYIIDPEEIPLEDAEKVIVSTWAKDFSKKIITQLRARWRKKKKKKVVSEKRYVSPRSWTQRDRDTQWGL